MFSLIVHHLHLGLQMVLIGQQKHLTSIESLPYHINKFLGQIVAEEKKQKAILK